MESVNTTIGAYTTINNVFLLEALKIAKEKYDLKYASFNPHLTFFICPLPKENSKKCQEQAISYLKNIKPFKITLSKLYLEKETMFLSMPVIGKKVVNIHKKLTQIANKYRNGVIRAKDEIRIKDGYYKPREVSYLKRYGFHKTMGEFFPHISVGKLAKDQDVQKIKNEMITLLKRVQNKQFLVDKIFLVFYYDEEVPKNRRNISLEEIKLR